MLNSFRVLDLTDEKGLFCGLIMAKLGAEVIKVEKPGGDPARFKGPFYHDIPDPEKSLYWFAYNAGKRGITLNIGTTEGQEIFKKLTRTADFIIESFAVDYLDSLNLGYQELRKINPRLILTSIAPFGQTGPYRRYKSSDIVAMATGGMMAICGEPDKPPLRLNPDHAYCIAGSEGALATLIAHYYRQMVSGAGQHVDVSIHDCVVRENNLWVHRWDMWKTIPKRSGAMLVRETLALRLVFPCQNGHIIWYFHTGPPGLRENLAISRWMKEEAIPGILEQLDWNSFDAFEAPKEEIEAIMNQVARLTIKHTKTWLEEEAMRRGVRFSPVNNIKDLYEYSQFSFRNYWVDVVHPELSDSITYPGHLFRSNKVESKIARRPPLIGEHNSQVYIGELGYSEKELVGLKQRGII